MRKPQGMKYSFPLLALCVLFTELVGNRRQRQRAAWLAGNWDWISQLAQDFGLEGNFDSSPSQSTLSRFFSKGDEHAIKQLYTLFETSGVISLFEAGRIEDGKISAFSMECGTISVKRLPGLFKKLSVAFRTEDDLFRNAVSEPVLGWYGFQVEIGYDSKAR